MNIPVESNSNLAIHTIIQLVWEQQTVSRAELSRLSGLSRSTITLNVDTLLSQGILIEKPTSEASKHARTQVAINKKLGIFVGVELDADCCEVGICNIMGSLLSLDCFSIEYTMGPEQIYDQLVTSIKNLQSTQPENQNTILGIGVGLPTPVDFQKGYAVHPAFMPGWHHYPIGDKLSQVFTCPVFVDNEVNTMAFGEAYLNQKYRGTNLLFLKLGVGIGAGMIVEGSIYRGNSGMSGNIGHIRVDNRQEPCQCGKSGCLEAIAGGNALLKKANEMATNGASPFLQQKLAENRVLKLHDLVAAIKYKDTEIITLVNESATTVGTMVGRLVMFFDPKVLVVGGALCDFGPQYIDYIRRAIIQEASPWIKSDFDVTVSRFGDSIGVIGSAMLSISMVLQHGMILEKFTR
ncbi:ROK family protein [uncultured Sphaerochaeta sp.]|uniref:ROK family transcriptional regulator n=1 Tax=uncultured Sphaerochaeta sp. TaxID=886478 RepID=UPI002AA73315|nr:ROK family protein [uncultured Sphaerochaeta sp.]